MAYRNRYDEYLRKRREFCLMQNSGKLRITHVFQERTVIKRKAIASGRNLTSLMIILPITMISPLLIATLMMVGAELILIVRISCV